MLTEWIMEGWFLLLEGITFITQNNTTGLICQLIIGALVIPVWLLFTVAYEKREERHTAPHRRDPRIK